MRIKLIVWAMLALFCGSFAYATPILYTFTNSSGFTLGGVSYSGTDHIVDPGPRLTLTLYADTANVVTSGNFYTDTPGTQFVANRSAVGVVSYGGLTLATITDPVELVIDTEGFAYLVDGANQKILISALTGPYDGVSNYPILGSPGFPTTAGFNTSVGELNFTDLGSNTTFGASLSGTSSVPEPASILFVSTGALGLLGAFRRLLPVA